MKKFKEILNEGKLESIDKLIQNELKKSGIPFSVNARTQFIRYTLRKTIIVWDGQNIDVIDRDTEKSLGLFDRPKLSYKQAVDFADKQ